MLRPIAYGTYYSQLLTLVFKRGMILSSWPIHTQDCNCKVATRANMHSTELEILTNWCSSAVAALTPVTRDGAGDIFSVYVSLSSCSRHAVSPQ